MDFYPARTGRLLLLEEHILVAGDVPATHEFPEQSRGENAGRGRSGARALVLGEDRIGPLLPPLLAVGLFACDKGLHMGRDDAGSFRRVDRRAEVLVVLLE